MIHGHVGVYYRLLLTQILLIILLLLIANCRYLLQSLLMH
nr:MAG TPA: hypothetical protein [Caudoviricetes sp.]